MLEKFTVNNISEFYSGSIAPDSFCITPTYYDLDGVYEKYIAAHLFSSDFTIWKKAVKDFMIMNKLHDNYDFYFGYGVHILTDIIWKETTGVKVAKKYNDAGEPEEKLRTVYYSEAEQFEFDLYEEFELKKDVWGYLTDCPKIGISGMISADEINNWRKGVMHLFDNKENRHKPIKYFLYEDLIKFIENAAETLSGELYKLTI
jgi:hypothetical protein